MPVRQMMKLSLLLQKSLCVYNPAFCFQKTSTFADLARVVELADTYVSEAYAERHAGSTPVPGTIIKDVSRQMRDGEICGGSNPISRTYERENVPPGRDIRAFITDRV